MVIPKVVLKLQLGAKHRIGVEGWVGMVPRGSPSSPTCGRLPLGELLVEEDHVSLLVVRSPSKVDLSVGR